MLLLLAYSASSMYIITTKDGSHSLFTDAFDEIYHSGNGAIQESTHVFIQSGFKHAIATFPSPTTIHILEVGFGTGLNALLTIITGQEHGRDVYYETMELYPVPMDVVKELNYAQLLGDERSSLLFHALHDNAWNATHTITPHFSFKKNQVSFLSFVPAAETFHLIYFDAFAPGNQPEMWTLEMMQKLYRSLVVNGVLVSYCSKSAFRKNLVEAGFKVEKLPGPPGKREMVRAFKL